MTCWYYLLQVSRVLSLLCFTCACMSVVQGCMAFAVCLSHRVKPTSFRSRPWPLPTTRIHGLSVSSSVESSMDPPNDQPSDALTDTVDESSSTVAASEPPPSSPPRRPYRPGFNSYLKVTVDDATIQTLHQSTLEIRDWLESQQIKEQETESTEAQAPAPGLRVKPRSATSLHLTLLFGGEVLGEIPANELQRWHAEVSDRLRQAGFALAQDTKADSVVFHPDEYWLSLDRIVTFPPRRNNLLVARLQASPSWQVLYSDLVELTRNASYSPSLRQISVKSHAAWTPHITLANLQGKRGSYMDDLRVHLDEVSLRCEQDKSPPVSVSGIAMGGPVPTQDPSLDWNFVPCVDLPSTIQNL